MKAHIPQFRGPHLPHRQKHTAPPGICLGPDDFLPHLPVLTDYNTVDHLPVKFLPVQYGCQPSLSQYSQTVRCVQHDLRPCIYPQYGYSLLFQTYDQPLHILGFLLCIIPCNPVQYQYLHAGTEGPAYFYGMALHQTQTGHRGLKPAINLQCFKCLPHADDSLPGRKGHTALFLQQAQIFLHRNIIDDRCPIPHTENSGSLGLADGCKYSRSAVHIHPSPAF